MQEKKLLKINAVIDNHISKYYLSSILNIDVKQEFFANRDSIILVKDSEYYEAFNKVVPMINRRTLSENVELFGYYDEILPYNQMILAKIVPNEKTYFVNLDLIKFSNWKYRILEKDNFMYLCDPIFDSINYNENDISERGLLIRNELSPLYNKSKEKLHKILDEHKDEILPYMDEFLETDMTGKVIKKLK